MLVLVMRWVEDGIYREQAYGPIDARPDHSHWPQVEATMTRWRSEHPALEVDNATMYLMSPAAT